MPNIADTIPPRVYLSGGTAFGQALLRSTDAGALARATAGKASDIPSADTVDLSLTNGPWGDITGTTTITGVTLPVGASFLARFTGALTLTHGASLVLPGSANITTAAGDWAFFIGDESGVTRVVFYSKADGTPVAGGGGGGNPEEIVFENGTTLSQHESVPGIVTLEPAAGVAEFYANTFYGLQSIRTNNAILEDSGLYINGTKVIAEQQSSISDASGGSTIDAEARTALNAILAALRTHGLIAT